MSLPRLQLDSGPPLTRRQALLALLAGAATVALPTGCTSQSLPPPVDNNRVLLESAYGVESALLGVLTADDAPARIGLRSEAELVVQEHLDRLSEVLNGSVPSSETSGADESGGFAAAAREAADAHLAGVRDASPQASQMLSSLAASDLVLSQAFQDGPPEPPQ